MIKIFGITVTRGSSNRVFLAKKGIKSRDNAELTGSVEEEVCACSVWFCVPVLTRMAAPVDLELKKVPSP